MVGGHSHQVEVKQGQQLTLHALKLVVAELVLARSLQIHDEWDLLIELLELCSQQQTAVGYQFVRFRCHVVLGPTQQREDPVEEPH